MGDMQACIGLILTCPTAGAGGGVLPLLSAAIYCCGAQSAGRLLSARCLAG